MDKLEHMSKDFKEFRSETKKAFTDLSQDVKLIKQELKDTRQQVNEAEERLSWLSAIEIWMGYNFLQLNAAKQLTPAIVKKDSSDHSDSDGDHGEEQSRQLKPRRLQAPSKRLFTKSPTATENTDDQPGPNGEVRRRSRQSSRVSSQHPSPTTANTAGSDEFSETDLDSSDEWLPSGSTALSQDTPDRF